ncbi:hypothetical protein GCM10010277_60330 [Streptomyces longisporoflavus]|nr:hypothetical protein GCM10010277_60330 [Streptomyces longisporoflavus]
MPPRSPQASRAATASSGERGRIRRAVEGAVRPQPDTDTVSGVAMGAASGVVAVAESAGIGVTVSPD